MRTIYLAWELTRESWHSLLYQGRIGKRVESQPSMFFLWSMFLERKQFLEVVHLTILVTYTKL